jgi:NAD-dependent dihydropyrimidine dehydrogenase PreA subunit
MAGQDGDRGMADDHSGCSVPSGHEFYRRFNVYVFVRREKRNTVGSAGADSRVSGRLFDLGVIAMDRLGVYMNNLIYLKNVVTLKLDEEKCNGCGMCLDVCPHDVFKKNGRHVLIKNRDACMECGACSLNCPANAIYVQSGVGCANAVINSMLGRTSSDCCCSLQPDDSKSNETCKCS